MNNGKDRAENISPSGFAPGGPGSPPRWALAAKTGVGTSLSNESRVWFTLSEGIVNEVFHPCIDTACIRDCELLVTDRQNFFSEERRDTNTTTELLAPGVPAYRLTNKCTQGRYLIRKVVLADPYRPTLLQQIAFEPYVGTTTDYSVFALLNPHLRNEEGRNRAWCGEFKGVPMLFAQSDSEVMALACSTPWLKRSVGFVGSSDGWQDVFQHRRMAWCFERAEDGNVAMCGEVDLASQGGEFLLAVSFGRDEGEAGHRARASLLQGFEAARKVYVAQWVEWQRGLELTNSIADRHDLQRISGAVLRCHEDKGFPGGIIASMANPWGPIKSEAKRGYHLIWPRDMIQAVGGLLAVGKHDDARRALDFFRTSQDADGHWPQNMRVSGKPYWNGIQLDETALVVLLMDLARREGALSDFDVFEYWPMIRLAVSYLVSQGPLTPLDRWEGESGYFPSTMAVEIAALLVAADLAEKVGEETLSDYLRETADSWNDAIDRLTYASDTELAHQCGVDGYYVRFARADQMEYKQAAAGDVTITNHPPGQGRHPIADIVSPDALMLVRFGLRSADDHRILNTLRVIDELLKVETPQGPSWRRYTDDGYGEHADGSPFDGTGIGRPWPLLTGERGHYELAAGHSEEAKELLHAMERFANDTGFLSEQIWDCEDIPELGLFRGKPSGSAMPLVWAHAEYVKLKRSLRDNRVFDTPTVCVKRYLSGKPPKGRPIWRFNQQCRSIPKGRTLRLEVLAPATVHWSADHWNDSHDSHTEDTALGLHYVDLPTGKLNPGDKISFTFYWTDAERWEDKNFDVTVQSPSTMDGETASSNRSTKALNVFH